MEKQEEWDAAFNKIRSRLQSTEDDLEKADNVIDMLNARLERNAMAARREGIEFAVGIMKTTVKLLLPGDPKNQFIGALIHQIEVDNDKVMN